MTLFFRLVLVSLLGFGIGIFQAASASVPVNAQPNATVSLRSRAPLPTDDRAAGYVAGASWVQMDKGECWTATDVTPGAAVWQKRDPDQRLLLDAIPQALNALITANTAEADFIVDVGADPTIGTYASSSAAALYVGALHPTAKGDAYYAQTVAKAINAIKSDRSTMVKVKTTRPLPQGQRVFTCGHSFHVWVADILVDMAKGAGIRDHGAVGLSSIGGSRVIQHWDVPEAQNAAKKALSAGNVDVLTLSPIWLPDEGIEKFAALAVAHNPDIRVTVQEYWLPNDEYVPVYPLQTGKKVDHNAATMPELRKCHDLYFHDMDAAVCEVNRRLGKKAVSVVPAGQAVLALRERIIAGKAPGLQAQAELFTDSWGHPAAPVMALAAYCHFAVIYHRSPVGLPLPKILAGNPNWGDPLNRVLQELAWDAVTQHPLSGVTQ